MPISVFGSTGHLYRAALWTQHSGHLLLWRTDNRQQTCPTEEIFRGIEACRLKRDYCIRLFRWYGLYWPINRSTIHVIILYAGVCMRTCVKCQSHKMWNHIIANYNWMEGTLIVQMLAWCPDILKKKRSQIIHVLGEIKHYLVPLDS